MTNTTLLVDPRPPNGELGRQLDGRIFGGDVPQVSFAEWSRHAGSPSPRNPRPAITGTTIRDDVSAGQRGRRPSAYPPARICQARGMQMATAFYNFSKKHLAAQASASCPFKERAESAPLLLQ
ncbi:hypothetical protein VTI28DRAFT_8034 [Corynascus sepedonium]